ELAAVGALREGRAVDRDMALEDTREAVLLLRARLTRADPDGARDVGRAVAILPARIAQEHAARLDRKVRVLIDPVVRDRRVGPGGGDRVEAVVLQRPGGEAKFLQPGRGGELGFPALGRFDREPVEESRDCRAVAFLRVAMAL